MKETLQKILKFVVLPFTIIFAILQIIKHVNVSKAESSLKETEKKDQDLLKKQNEVENQIIVNKTEVSMLEKQVEELPNKVDENWHKK